MDFRELAPGALGASPGHHPGSGDDAVVNAEGPKKRGNRAMAFLPANPITPVTSGAGRRLIQNKHTVFI